MRLTELQLAESRNKAKAMIEGGFTSVNGITVIKPSFEVSQDDEIKVADGTLAYVGRGGLKLEAALDAFKVDVTGMRAVDIGSSTGGFTDCMLKRGACCVYAVDSGKDQLHPSLVSDPRVHVHEGFNARFLTRDLTDGPVDIAVCDVSFISQTLIHQAVSDILHDKGIFISLIKPQFEAGREYLNKNGIVRDKKAMLHVVEKVILSAQNIGMKFTDIILSPIKGGNGNTEFLACFQKTTSRITNDISFRNMIMSL